MSQWLAIAATCNGVRPSSSLRFTCWGKHVMNSSTASMKPRLAARCIGVTSWKLTRVGSAPASRRIFMAWCFLACTAQCRAVSPSESYLVGIQYISHILEMSVVHAYAEQLLSSNNAPTNVQTNQILIWCPWNCPHISWNMMYIYCMIPLCLIHSLLECNRVEEFVLSTLEWITILSSWRNSGLTSWLYVLTFLR